MEHATPRGNQRAGRSSLPLRPSRPESSRGNETTSRIATSLTDLSKSFLTAQCPGEIPTGSGKIPNRFFTVDRAVWKEVLSSRTSSPESGVKVSGPSESFRSSLNLNYCPEDLLDLCLDQLPSLEEAAHKAGHYSSFGANDFSAEECIAEWHRPLGQDATDYRASLQNECQLNTSQTGEAQLDRNDYDSVAASRLNSVLRHLRGTAHKFDEASAQQSDIELDSQALFWQRAFSEETICNFQEELSPVKHFEFERELERQTHFRRVNAVQRHHIHHHNPVRREQEGDEEKEDMEPPKFHCPYIGCHERFCYGLNLWRSSNEPGRLLCPHVDCGAHFEETEEWMEHFQGAHHDLLDSSMRDEDRTELD